MKSLANKKLFLLDHSDSRHHISETFISTFMPRSSRTKMLLSTFFKIPHLYKHGLNPPPSLELRCGILPPFRGQLQTLISKKMWNVNFRLANEPITVIHHHKSYQHWQTMALPSPTYVVTHLSSVCLVTSPLAADKNIIIQSCTNCSHLQWVDWFLEPFPQTTFWPAAGFF